jgi:DNA-binding beta-propeller fold protein YncE
VRTLALVLTAAASVLALTLQPAKTAVPQAAACPHGATRAVIEGHATCLRVGAVCRKARAAGYRKYGYACINGRLSKAARKPAPKPSPFPVVPPAPDMPPKTVQMPPAEPLPAGAAKLALRAASWTPDSTELALTPDAVWTASGLFRIDPASTTASGPYTRAESADIGAGEGSVWASDYDNDAVRRFDSATGKLLAKIQLPAGSAPEGIVDTGGAIWVATHHGGTLVRIDPTTNRIAATIVLTTPGSGGPQGVAAGLGSVWVGVGNASAVFRIDPATNKIAAIIPAPMDVCGGIAVGVTAVWVTSCLDDTKVGRIDPSTNKFVSVLDVGGKVIQAAAEGDSVWFVAGGDPDISLKDPAYLIRLRADDTVATRIRLPNGFISGGAAVAFGSVWAMDFAHPTVIRVPDPG